MLKFWHPVCLFVRVHPFKHYYDAVRAWWYVRGAFNLYIYILCYIYCYYYYNKTNTLMCIHHYDVSLSGIIFGSSSVIWFGFQNFWLYFTLDVFTILAFICSLHTITKRTVPGLRHTRNIVVQVHWIWFHVFSISLSLACFYFIFFVGFFFSLVCCACKRLFFIGFVTELWMRYQNVY